MAARKALTLAQYSRFAFVLSASPIICPGTEMAVIAPESTFGAQRELLNFRMAASCGSLSELISFTAEEDDCLLIAFLTCR
ncbi:hypothetical protein DAI18_01585 [Microvirgula aerodenitrificans]|uniref:Uncharacterized protein n=1 Tax=Microvirgula aerodenitrificans TaxID=57480 RepID=A0A2U3THI4_9NEIS|nr:hypothetical protein DAI18_01585 [Microvirgula aerodenitrificans]